MNPTVVEKLEENGMIFVGRDVENERMEILELKGRLIFKAIKFLFVLTLLTFCDIHKVPIINK